LKTERRNQQSGEVSQFLEGVNNDEPHSKRANRGYNPKYDNMTSQFITTTPDLKQTTTRQSRSGSESAHAADEESFNPNEVQFDENGNVRLNKCGVPVRKVGRPPKDKVQMEQKKEQDALRKSIKAQRQFEFRKLLQRD
jgi:hypothetical protein